MPQLIAGNWKMNGAAGAVAAYADALHAAPPGVDMLVCAPFPLLPALVAALVHTRVRVGAQDCHFQASGAHTGDVSPELLKEIGVSHVILGHSERRADHGESNAVVNAKVSAALTAGLVPIMCVGESEAERDAGAAADVVRTQLRHSLPENFAGVVAYEPVWAIGTGRTPSAADVTAMHAAIRAALAAQFPASGAGMQILYGGSVKPGNAAALLALPEVGGALVGGASLAAADFLGIAAGATGV